jgi:hypothetical protein
VQVNFCKRLSTIDFNAHPKLVYVCPRLGNSIFFI